MSSAYYLLKTLVERVGQGSEDRHESRARLLEWWGKKDFLADGRDSNWDQDR